MNSKFVTRHWNIVNDQSNANYSENVKKINANTVNASLNNEQFKFKCKCLNI